MDELFSLDEMRGRIRQLRARLAELDDLKTSIRSPSDMSGSGRTSGDHGAAFEFFVVQYDEVLLELVEALEKYFDTSRRIADRIELLENEQSKNALFYRFVQGLSMKEVSERCGFKPGKWIYKILKKAEAEYDALF